MATIESKTQETQERTETTARDQRSIRELIKQVVAENAPGLARLAPHDGPVEQPRSTPER